jgi:structural maintenance of chromosome 3 (chondroitin sulfate proteoglycan 6)
MDVNNALENLDEQRRNQIENSNDRKVEFDQRDKAITETYRELREMQQKLDLLLTEKRTLEYEQEENIKTKARVELVVDDLENHNVDGEATIVLPLYIWILIII